MRASALRWVGLVVLAAAFGLAGCETTTKDLGGPAKVASGKKRMIFLINTPDPYWEANRQGLEEGAKKFDLEAAGLTIEQDPNNGTTEGQVEKLRQYATQDDIVAVGISPWDADSLAIAEELRKLQKKGVKVITVDNDMNREKFRDTRTFYLGTDNLVAGQALGSGLKAVLEAKNVKSGEYAQFVGNTDSDNARKRMDGVKDKMTDAYKEVTREADGGEAGKCAVNVTNVLQNYNDIVCLVGIWAYNAPAIADVLDKSKKGDKVTVGCFDAGELSIAAMQEKKIDVMVVQNPFDMGVQTVRILKAMVQKDDATVKEMFPKQGEPDGDMYTTGLRIVVPDETSPVKKELFDPAAVEFMTLPAFREWLTKYGLKSS
jgi:ribose transport system substrate-binding protein